MRISKFKKVLIGISIVIIAIIIGWFSYTGLNTSRVGLTYKVTKSLPVYKGKKSYEIKQTTYQEYIRIEKDKFSKQIMDTISNTPLYETIYDFKDNRVIEIDHINKKFINLPLESIISERSHEKANRMAISSMLAAVKKNTKLTNQFELESLFGILSAKPMTDKLDVRVKDGKTVFYLNDKEEVALFSLSEISLENNLSKMFNKFVLYNFHIHPNIAKKLTSEQKIFNYLKFRFIGDLNDLASTTIYELQNKITKPKTISIPSDYSEYYSSFEKLNNILTKAYDIKNRMSKDEYFSLIDNLIQEHKYIEAYLANVEYITSYHDFNNKKVHKKLQEQMNVFVQVAKNDAMLKELINFFVKYQSKDSLSKRLEVYQNFKKDRSKRSGILDVFLGNTYLQTGNYPEAAYYFFEGLDSNPYTFEAYYGLGAVYYNEFYTRRAWECWNYILRFATDTKVVKAVYEYINYLHKNFPEYFTER